MLRERYRVDRLVGEGGFGALYQGVHIVLDAPVAIKVLRPQGGGTVAERGQMVSRFLDEARVLARLRHPHIVAAIDVDLLPEGESGERVPFIVMEWVNGENLRTFLRERGPLSLSRAWAVFEPLLEGVAFAHRARIVHRDLKPENVMVVEDALGQWSPRVVDFGIAKLLAPDDDAPSSVRTTSVHSAFTPAYAAPEQITQSRTGAWTDVHALGLLLIEMLTGQRPYGDGPEARSAAVDPVRPGRDVGGPLQAVIDKAVALRVGDRFADAGEMLTAARRAMAAVAPAVAAGSSAFVPRQRPSSAEETTGRISTQDSFAMGQHTVRSESSPAKVTTVPEAAAPRRRWAWPSLALTGAALASIAAGLVVARSHRGATTAPVAPLASLDLPPAYHAPEPTPALNDLIDRALVLIKKGDADAEAGELLERVPLEAPPFDKRAPEDTHAVAAAMLLIGRLRERAAPIPHGTTVATLQKVNDAALRQVNEANAAYALAFGSLDTMSCANLGMVRMMLYYGQASEAIANQVEEDVHKHGDNAARDGRAWVGIFRSQVPGQRTSALRTIDTALLSGFAGKDPFDGADCTATLRELQTKLRADADKKLGPAALRRHGVRGQSRGGCFHFCAAPGHARGGSSPGASSGPLVPQPYCDTSLSQRQLIPLAHASVAGSSSSHSYARTPSQQPLWPSICAHVVGTNVPDAGEPLAHARGTSPPCLAGPGPHP